MGHISGLIFDGSGFKSGRVHFEDGTVTDVEFTGSYDDLVIVPGLMDCHTHVGDAGLQVPSGISLEDLVAPPNGLKHRYLRETPDGMMVSTMRAYIENMRMNGIVRFADFREGGRKGCDLLRKADKAHSSIVFGRPISDEYDPEEVDSILNVSDGIGISSISDMPKRYSEALADHVHRKGKRLALHVSERVRENMDDVMSLEPDIIVHMCESTDADMRACADRDIPVVVCPRSNIHFGRTPPVGRLLDNGVTVGVGTDNAMLFSPDLRAECNIIRELLSSRSDVNNLISTILLRNGRKILNRGMGMGIEAGMSDIVVFPSSGNGPLEDILCSRTSANVIGK